MPVYIPGFGDIAFSLQRMHIALLGSDNSYSSPADVNYPQNFSYTPVMDNDTIKAQGANRELLSVIIGYEIEIEEAALSMDALNTLQGFTEVESGASGNRYASTDTDGAGRGFPYVGLVAVMTATIGSVTVGFPKAKLNAAPEGNFEQNTFRTGALNFDAVMLPSTNKGKRLVKYESDSDLLDFDTADDFDTFFGAYAGNTSIFGS